MESVHLIGIGGAGLSAIATVLLQQGYKVSGSDQQASANTDRLTAMGATVFIGHHAQNLGEAVDVVVVSSAIAPDNPELAAAQALGLKVAKRAEWLGHMMQGRVGIAIAGTHGKTTTTAMTAFVLREAGQDPTYIVGGYIPQLNTGAAAGQGQAFVVEADEYDHTFLGLHPQVAVVTTVEWDHPDIYPSYEDLIRAFTDFVDLVPPQGQVIGCGDDPEARKIIQRSSARVVSYGIGAENDWQAVDMKTNSHGGYDFRVVAPMPAEETAAAVTLNVPGLHNVYNALATLVVARTQGVEISQAAAALGRFKGVGRRFEQKGEAQGIVFIDDYAHHPTEIKATLAAARSRFGQRPVWAVFQPHTFSRTLSLFDDFLDAFDDADHVIVVDIYASREVDEGQISSRDLVEQMAHPDARYIGPLEDAASYLLEHLSSPAALITLGAGDGNRVGEWVLEKLGELNDQS